MLDYEDCEQRSSYKQWILNYLKVQNEKINKYLKHAFSCKCPSCNGILYYEEYDVACDRNVYKCSKCGELWF